MSAHPLMTILSGFAKASTRMMEVSEKEIHHGDALPVGEGWVRIEHLPVNRYSVWERKRWIEAAE